MELEIHWADDAAARVGRLYQNARGTVFFEYDEAWTSGNRELSPLYLPNTTRGALSTQTPAFGALHGLFQDALPDWWGERLMRSHFESLGIPWNRVTELRKLAAQGDRKMGALSFRPSFDSKDFNDGLIAELGSLVDAARSAVRGEPGEVLADLVRTGMSPGGAQPKALLSVADDFSEIRLDDPAPPGFGAWLLKFDIDPELQEGRIEHAFASMARAAGIDVPETRLIEAAGGAHFLVRRFDRGKQGERLHFHSFSGLTHTPLRAGLEYSELMDLARALCSDERPVEEIFRRAVFNVVAGNDDDHGRNHAFLMDATGTWRLSPAFDLTHASYPLASGFRAARVMGKAAGIRRRDLLKLAAAQAVRDADGIIDEVLAAVADWEQHAAGSGLNSAHASRVTPRIPLDL